MLWFRLHEECFWLIVYPFIDKGWIMKPMAVVKFQ